MKKTLVVWGLITVTLFSFFACSNNDREEVTIYEKNALNGKWHLTSYGGGIAGQFTNYKRGLVTWSFDTINKTVLISSKRNYFGPMSGTYPYELRRTEQNDSVLHLNDSVRGIFAINNDELIMRNAFTIIFKR